MSEADRVVFDCNIFAQAIITSSGNAARCVEHVLRGDLALFWSDYVIAEIRRTPDKPTPRKLGVTSKHVEALIDRLTPATNLAPDPPALYAHPIDPKDSHYVNLALANAANLIVSRDKHLLNLMDSAKVGAEEFKARFPQLLVMPPEELLRRLQSRPPTVQ